MTALADLRFEPGADPGLGPPFDSDSDDRYAMIGFGPRLTAARTAAGYKTQKAFGLAVSAKLPYEVNQSTLSRWENDKATPRLNELTVICDVLGCAADDLIGHSTGPEKVTISAEAGAALDMLVVAMAPVAARPSVDDITRLLREQGFQ